MYCERMPIPPGCPKGIAYERAKKQVVCGFGPQGDGVWPSVKRAIGLVTYLGLAMRRSLVRHHQLNGLWSV